MGRAKDREWRGRAVAWLAGEAAPAALTMASLRAGCSKAAGAPVGEGALRRAIADWERSGALRKARKGAWINAAGNTRGRAEDLLALARPGSVASLHSALGMAGAHRSPSVMAFGVCRAPDGEGAEMGALHTAAGQLNFYGLPERFFERGRGWTVQGPRHARFAPEKALLDWIWLGSAAGAIPQPSHMDIDLDKLDLRKAEAWSDALSMRDKFAAWLAAHPKPNEQALGVLAKAREDGLSMGAKLAARRASLGGPIRDRARARGLSA